MVNTVDNVRDGSPMTLGMAPDLRGLTPVLHRGLAEEVADRLREGIISGAFRPGQQLHEVDLATSLGVSRSPVRDALLQLDHEGLVQLRRYRAAVVVGLTLRDIEEVYSLRSALETLAVRLAAERASDDNVAALDAAAKRLPSLASPGSALELAHFDIQFHDLIYHAAGHRRLSAHWSTLRPQVHRFLVSRNIVNHGYEALAGEDHQELATAIASRDPERAVVMIQRHLNGAYTRLRHVYNRATVEQAEQPADATAPFLAEPGAVTPTVYKQGIRTTGHNLEAEV